MSKCPVCGKIATKQTGVQFPSDNTKFVQLCLHLKLNVKATNRKGIICYEHFDPKDLIKDGGRIVNISRMALPKPHRLTLDQLLEKNVGMPTSSAVSSLQNVSSLSTRQQFVSISAAPNHSLHMTNKNAGVFGSTHNHNHQQNCSVIQNVANWHGIPQDGHQTQGPTTRGSPNDAIAEQLADTAKKTLVLFRESKEPFSSQNAVSEWLRQSFDLSANAIRDISPPSTVANSQVTFIVLDEIRTAENILEMSKSERKSHLCALTSAIDFQPNSSAEFVGSAFSDENAWRNLAAAMVPAYNHLVAAASSHCQLHLQTSRSNLAAAAVRGGKANTAEGNSSKHDQIA